MNNEEVISHHGILGQRWGFRRFQNPDGSLTPAGRKRAQKLKGEYKALTGKKLKGKIPEDNPDNKKIHDLTDKELSDRITRLKNEREAHALENDLSSNGSKFRKAVRERATAALLDAGQQVLTQWFKKQGIKLFGMDTKPIEDEYTKLKKELDISNAKKNLRINDDFFKKKEQEDRAEAEAKKKAKQAEKNAKKEARERERQIDKTIDAWERQQEANREFAREMESQRNARQKYDASDTDRGKSVVKDAVYIEKEPSRLSYKEQYLLPYKK